MDKKTSHQNKQRRWHKQVRNYSSAFQTMVQAQKNHILTGFLLVLIVGLLCGIVSQWQLPALSDVPGGVTAIDFSLFVQQVKASNVEAVVLQRDAITGLLVQPLDGGKRNATLHGSADRNREDADYALWYRSLENGNSVWSSASSTPPIDPARIVYTQIPGGSDSELLPLLLKYHVKVGTHPAVLTNQWFSALLHFLPFVALIIILLAFMVVRRTPRFSNSSNTHFSRLGKSRARRFGPSHSPRPEITHPRTDQRKARTNKALTPGQISTLPPVTFDDVAGIDEVRAELEEIVQFLRTPERFDRLGARIPQGALLVGPPGTGKTLLARAVAGEAGVPFFSMSASEFVEMFVGVGASRVRDLFKQARQVAPSVIFIDELDAAGRKRSMRATNNDERDQTLNQLLVELDGFDPRHAVVVLAATNRIDILDKALLRPGRFDRHITVSLPDRVGREAILKIHTRSVPLEKDVCLARLARLTTGMSGADLANLVNEAALSAARRDMEHVSQVCFEEALARVQLGAFRPLVMGETDRRIIAYHEGGHALVAYHLAEADDVNRVTILPRGQSLGVTQFVCEEDRYNYSREMLMARIAVGLGGRVAEELIFGSNRVTTGAENDLQQVTNLARRMVTRWGMSDKVGLVFADYQVEDRYAINAQRIEPDALPSQAHILVVDPVSGLKPNGHLLAQQPTFSVAASAQARSASIMMNAVVDREVQRILNEGRAMAYRVLEQHKDQLTLLADTLMEYEQIDRQQFEALLKQPMA